MDQITWPVAVSIIGTLVVLAGFLTNYLKSDESPWAKDLQESEDAHSTNIRDLENRATIIEGKLGDISRRVTELKEAVQREDDFHDKQREKMEEKLERLTKLMIEILQSANS